MFILDFWFGGENLHLYKKHTLRYLILTVLFLISLTYNLFYYYDDKTKYSPIMSAFIGVFIFSLLTFLFHKWYLHPYSILVNSLERQPSTKIA